MEHTQLCNCRPENRHVESLSIHKLSISSTEAAHQHEFYVLAELKCKWYGEKKSLRLGDVRSLSEQYTTYMAVQYPNGVKGYGRYVNTAKQVSPASRIYWIE